MQKLTNLVFILILALMGTVLPLNTQIMNINLTEPIITNPGTTEPTGTTQTGRISMLRPNYGPIGFGGVDELVLSFESTNGLFGEDFFRELRPELVFFSGENEVARAGIGGEPHASSGINLREVRIGASKLTAMLGEPAAYYIVKLELYGRKTDISLDGVWTLSTLAYTGVVPRFMTEAETASLPAGQRALTLHFPDADYASVVPVSRVVPEAELSWLNVYRMIRTGSSAFGLHPSPALPLLRQYDVTSGSAAIDISGADSAAFVDTPERVQVLGDAVNQTYRSYRGVGGTTIRLDGRTIYQVTNQSAAGQRFELKRSADGALLLCPAPLEQPSANPQERAAQLFEALQRSNIVPPNIRLEEVFLAPETGALEVRLSPEYTTALADHPEYDKLMKTALALSWYSMPEVRSLTIGGEPIARITAYNMEPQ